MMEFLYTGSISKLGVPEAMSMLPMCDHFWLDELKVICENKIVSNLDPTNVIDTLFTIKNG
mgnify:CR=1 FL=1